MRDREAERAPRGCGADEVETVEEEDALRLSEERLRLALEATGEVVWDWHVAEDRIYQGPRWARMLGYPPETTPDSMRRFRPFVHPEDLPVLERETARALAGATDEISFEHRVRSASGEWRWLLARARVVARNERGEGVRLVGTCADIGAQKRAEEALRDSDRRREQFLATLSHELRNPLGAARNSLFVLEHAPPGGAQARSARAILERQLRQLTQVVDDLLDVSRIASGKIHLHPSRLDLAEVARRAAEDHRALFVAKGVPLLLELPPEPLWVDCDPTRMAQVLGNLLQNAAKFTTRGYVKLAVDPDAGGRTARVRVRDTGVGIEPGLRSRLFRAFEQAESTIDRSQGGLGLGLALVKGLVEMHGGTVEANSDGPGTGAEFVIRLPRCDAPAAGRPAAAPPEASTALRVLAVEDDEDAGVVLGDMLVFLGHGAEVARSGPEALDAVRRTRPDVVLCDIGLPGMSGYELARALRADREADRPVLIALTGYASPADVQRAADAGFDRHLAKPVSPEELSSVLAAVARRGTRAPPSDRDPPAR